MLSQGPAGVLHHIRVAQQTDKENPIGNRKHECVTQKEIRTGDVLGG